MNTNTITVTRSPWGGGKDSGAISIVTYTGDPIPFTEAEWAAEGGGELWVSTPGWTNTTPDFEESHETGKPYDHKRKPGQERSIIEKEHIVGFIIRLDPHREG